LEWKHAVDRNCGLYPALCLGGAGRNMGVYMCVLGTEEFGKAWKVSEESVKHLYPDFYDCMC